MTVDQDIYPHATGQALKTVEAHQSGEAQDIVFYCGWFCPFAQRTWLVLEEKGIPYTYHEELPYKKDPEFLKVNPRGLVPALLYKGQALYESLVLCEFLEEVYPDRKPLLPKDPVERARVRIAIDGISKKVMPAFYKLLQQTDSAKHVEDRRGLVEALNVFQEDIQGPWFAGGQLTLADLVLAPFVVRFNLLERHRGFHASQVGAKFEEWCKRAAGLPSVQATLSDEDKYEQVYGRYLRNEAQSEVAKATRSGGVLP